MRGKGAGIWLPSEAYPMTLGKKIHESREGGLSPVSAESLSRALPRPCRAFSRIL